MRKLSLLSLIGAGLCGLSAYTNPIERKQEARLEPYEIFSLDQYVNDEISRIWIEAREKELVREIEGCPKNPEVMECFRKAEKIPYDYYEAENGIILWRTPKETEEDQSGDCEDKSFYLQDLLEKKGLIGKPVFGKFNTKDKSGLHIWIEFEEDGELYVLDPTIGKYFPSHKRPAGYWVPLKVPPYIEERFEDWKKRANKPDMVLNEDYPEGCD